MAAGSMDRPPMLATRRYPQWRSRFLRYIDTRPNGEALRKCILSGPYKPTTFFVQAVDATDDSLAIPEHTTIETPMNMSPKNKAHFEAEKEAIHLILTGIRDEIYSTVDACQTAQERWEAVERLQQGESLNIQDVKTNLFWKFEAGGKDRPPMLAPGNYVQWKFRIKRYIDTKPNHELIHYCLKNPPYKFTWVDKEVPISEGIDNDIYSTVDACPNACEMWKAIERQRDSQTEPPSETASEEDNDPEQAQKDKDMQKNLALIAKYFKKIDAVAFCLGLRFALEDLAFCLQKILRFVFRRSCILSSEVLHFVIKDIAFCLGSIAFCLLQRSCILSMKHCLLPKSRILRFVSEALRFVYFQYLAFCLRNTAFCL
nr:hypothetical protein [Tanacetum cinerariifolium]